MAGVAAVSFPASPYPKGWFQVGRSSELKKGEVQAIEYFGEHLVLWRGESGDVFLQDAYCLHLGANRGIKGTVIGEDLQCPWHGWQWDGEGRNTCIPYSKEGSKPRLRIKKYRVKDWCGIIVMWFSPDGTEEPEWELVDLPESSRADFYSMFPHGCGKWIVRSHVQMPVENAVDPAHIQYVHGSSQVPEVIQFETKDHTFVSEVAVLYGGGHNATELTPEGQKVATFRIDHQGLGIATIHWGEMLWPTAALIGFTPIDSERIAYFYQQASLRGEGEEGDVPQGKAARMLKMQMQVVEQDFFTWENMKYLPRANFAAEEAKNYAELRRWASQFYPDEDARKMVDAVAGGVS